MTQTFSVHTMATSIAHTEKPSGDETSLTVPTYTATHQPTNHIYKPFVPVQPPTYLLELTIIVSRLWAAVGERPVSCSIIKLFARAKEMASKEKALAANLRPEFSPWPHGVEGKNQPPRVASTYLCLSSPLSL